MDKLMYYRNFSIREESEWNSYIEQCLNYEIYQTWYYHKLYKDGEPILFVYEESDFFIALPLIKRKIKDSSYYDFTSVYGYCGPVSSIDLSCISNFTRQNFKSAFVNFMKEEQSICVFSRLHPFLNQNYLLECIGGLRDNGMTVYMDLTMPVENQKNNYHKRLQRQIKRLREKGYLIKEANTQDEIKMFTEMYHQNMDRLNASTSYYFDEQYFTNLLKVTYPENKLILIFDGPELICGAIILVSHKIIRNHLSATSAEGVKESPSKLMTDEISMIGRKLGKDIFHLGGGLNGREDSLFQFKSYFSNLLIKDTLWCYVNDHKIYNELIAERAGYIDHNSNFFPLYRQYLKKDSEYIADNEANKQYNS